MGGGEEIGGHFYCFVVLVGGVCVFVSPVRHSLGGLVHKRRLR